MLNANAQAWVAALRSGKYKQGRNALSTDIDGMLEFCLLGVACELYRVKVGGQWAHSPLNPKRVFVDLNGDYRIAALPKAVMDWLGIADHLEGAYCVDTLVSLNDHLDFTFEQIANAIEFQLEGLFRAE